ncbi:MAG: GNAT family N-acetyltransferase [Clostridia bacterium]|nr:GNAT family N-acetyltransferase [Clostridia bacterium]
MIRKVVEAHIAECVQVIRESFRTVADAFGFTEENAPGFTAFVTDEQRLKWHMYGEERPMYGYFDGDKMVGYYSLMLQENNQCEMSNLCVLPSYRHKGIGEALMQHAFDAAKKLGCTQVNIGIVEENKVLRAWYEKYGFVHLGTKKFDRFPFTCGFLKKNI